MKRLKVVFTRRLYLFAAISLAVAVIALLLALKLSPWLYAMNIPVKLHMPIAAQTKIKICWDKQQTQCLPLVPYLSAQKRMAGYGEIPDVWLSELPPRPAYTISLILQSTVSKQALKSIEFDSRELLLWGKIPGAGMQGVKLRADQFIEQRALNKQGRSLMANTDIKPGPANVSNLKTILLIWGLLYSAYLLFAIPLYLSPFALQNSGMAARSERVSHYPWWAYLLYGIAILMLFLFILNSPLQLTRGDQTSYLFKTLGVSWLDYTMRPPGYYAFLTFILSLSDYNLDGVPLAHVICLTVATTICMWALRKWLHPWVALLVILGIFFSPSQIHWMLSIMRESIFSSIVLVAVASVIAHFTTTNKMASIIWLGVFSIMCTLALLVRENGILLPVILLPALLPETLKRLKASGKAWQRIQSIFQLWVRYAIPVLCTLSVYLGLSYYNYSQYHYFQFTRHATSHRSFFMELTTASFDSRSLLTRNPSMSADAKKSLGTLLYHAFILSREKEPGTDTIYAGVFPALKRLSGVDNDDFDWFHGSSIIEEIGQSAATLAPWETNWIGLIRQYREFILSTDNNQYYLVPDNPTSLAGKQKLLQDVIGLVNIKGATLTYEGKPTSPKSIINQYFYAVGRYPWYYPLFLLALIFSLYLLRYDDPILLIPITLFMSNAFLLLLLRFEYSRFIQCLDILLVLQVGLGLSSLIHRHAPAVLKKIRA